MTIDSIPSLAGLTLAFLFAAGCGDSGSGDEDAGTGTDTDAAATPLTVDEVTPVATAYADLVYATYDDALSRAEALDVAVQAFVDAPDAETHEAAKAAWLEARSPYGQSEGFRFYDGPIDDADGPEGQLNAWPMDESYVDGVEGMPDSGIINDPDVDITADMLASLNEEGGEENVATGYHAIEFLLWGQDLSEDGPGARTFEDYVDGGPASHPDRRGLYLRTVSGLLLTDLQAVRDEWADESGAYRAEFLALSPDALIQKVMRGIGTLTAAELSEERMNVAYDTKLQEDEHSCFSDNTHNDILYNFLSIANVVRGRYGSVQGPGLITLVHARDPALAQAIEDHLVETEALIMAIPAPFDQAIEGDDADPGRMAVAAAIESLRDLGDLFVQAASLMDLTLNTSLE